MIESEERVGKAKKRPTSDLKSIHQATLFPSLGFLDEKRNVCRALIHGRVFIDGQIPLGTRILLKGLKRAMKITPEQVASETFQKRIDGFLAAPGKRRKIVLQIGSQHYRLLRRTRRNGSFYGTLRLPETIAARAVESSTSTAIPMDLMRSHDSSGSIAPTSGQIFFVPPKGVSVITDIDDTIKQTNAPDRADMLANTFLRPFEVIQGMAELYQDWLQEGCAFHYVSSSPWQLYEPLSELCSQTNFPQGSMHLRYFRVRDQMFKRFRLVRRHSKVGIIAGILKRLPRRHFVLVGDSGENDPEIYRFLAKRFPKQVSAILIREVAAKPMTPKRLDKLLTLQDHENSKNPAVDIRIFREPSEIRDVVSGLKAK